MRIHACCGEPESLSDVLRNVMCRLLIDNSAKRWLGELAPSAQATPKQIIKTMGVLFQCGVQKHPSAMALLESHCCGQWCLLLKAGTADGMPIPGGTGHSSVDGGSGVLAVLQGKEFPGEDGGPCKALLMMQN